MSLQIKENFQLLGVIALAEVYVEILDENDNPPIFDLRRYEVVIKPDVSVGKVLFKVSCILCANF